MRIPVAPIGNGETLPDGPPGRARRLRAQSGGFLQPRVPYRLGEGAACGRSDAHPALDEHGEAACAPS